MKELVHKTAIINPEAIIEDDVEVGPYTIIHSNVVIKSGSRIGAFCELGVESSLGNGSPLIIGTRSHIRSHSVFYESSEFGADLITGHRVTVRENTFAGVNFQIGTLCDIQGDSKIGDYVRFHSNVHIGKKSTIGDFVWIFPYVVLTNDPHPPSNILSGPSVEDYAVIATMSIILPGVRVGRGAFIGAHSSLSGDAEPGMLYVGSPAKNIGKASRIKLQDGTGRPAYPWIDHFSRGYPEKIVEKWGLRKPEDNL
ncbi:MAG: N-acetyltransferase [Candidatus Reddybacter sp.]